MLVIKRHEYTKTQTTLAPSGVAFGGPAETEGGQNTQWDCVRSAIMPPKQRTKAELKQAVDELTEKLRAAEARLDADVEAERDEALARADEAE